MIDLCNPCAFHDTTTTITGEHRGRLSIKDAATGFAWDEAFCGLDLSNPWRQLRQQTQEDGDYSLEYGSSDEDHDHDNDPNGYGGHAALHYDDVEQAGPPAGPVDFPTPFLQPAERTTIRALDHRTLEVRRVKHVLMATTRTMSHADGPDRCYLLKKKTAKSPLYGSTYLSVVLKRRDLDNINDSEEPESEKKAEDGDFALGSPEWESTDELVSITVAPFAKRNWPPRVSYSENNNTKDPLRAIAAMQHVGNYHPHVLGCIEVLQDDQNLYTITRLQTGIDLQSRILSGKEMGTYYPCETNARPLFHQLLQGLFHLQKKGVYHSELSLETIFVDSQSKLVISQFGNAVRVPYNDPSNLGCIVGETEGTTRRLVRLGRLSQQHPPESLMYLAPELLEQEPAMDGFAADIWSLGVILFILLIGMAPFKSAQYWDDAYSEISNGRLKQILLQLNICLSEEATNLLQNMFWKDPRKRLTLAEIMDHAWTKNEKFPPKQSRTSSLKLVHQTSQGESGLGALAPSEASTVPSSSPSASTGTKRTSISRALSSLFGGSTSSCGAESPNSSSSSKSVVTVSNKSLLWGACGTSSGSFLLPKSRRSSMNNASSSNATVETNATQDSSTNREKTESTTSIERTTKRSLRKSSSKNLKSNNIHTMLALPNL